jgi:hypothetical protein
VPTNPLAAATPIPPLLPSSFLPPQRRSSSRNLQLNPAGSAQAGPSDFMTGIAAAKAAMAKLNVASSTSAKELSHMAPF